jgi:chemotaxis protein histidine kinase CheA/ActR/RegA family two-component response regulator
MENDRILGYFLEEASEHLNTIEQGLRKLPETVKQPTLIRELFRAAHSIGGSAAMLGLLDVQKIGKQFEANFKLLKEQPEITVDTHLQSLFLESFSFLQASINNVRESSDPYCQNPNAEDPIGDPVFAELKAHLQHLLASATPAPVAPTRSSNMEKDPTIEQVFGEYVTRKLEDILTLCLQPDRLEIRTEIQQICQKLASLGENFEFLEWTNLFTACRLAIANPDNYLPQLGETISIAVKQAQILVLADRHQSIGVTPDLEALINRHNSLIERLDRQATEKNLPDLLSIDAGIVSELKPKTSAFSADFNDNLADVFALSDADFDPDAMELNEFVNLIGNDLPSEGTWMQDDDFFDREIGLEDLGNSVRDLIDRQIPEPVSSASSTDLVVAISEDNSITSEQESGADVYDEETFYNPDLEDRDIPSFWLDPQLAVPPQPLIPDLDLLDNIDRQLQPDLSPDLDLDVPVLDFSLDSPMSGIFPTIAPSKDWAELEESQPLSLEMTSPIKSISNVDLPDLGVDLLDNDLDIFDNIEPVAELAVNDDFVNLEVESLEQFTSNSELPDLGVDLLDNDLDIFDNIEPVAELAINDDFVNLNTEQIEEFASISESLDLGLDFLDSDLDILNSIEPIGDLASLNIEQFTNISESQNLDLDFLDSDLEIFDSVELIGSVAANDDFAKLDIDRVSQVTSNSDFTDLDLDLLDSDLDVLNSLEPIGDLAGNTDRTNLDLNILNVENLNTNSGESSGFEDLSELDFNLDNLSTDLASHESIDLGSLLDDRSTSNINDLGDLDALLGGGTILASENSAFDDLDALFDTDSIANPTANLDDLDLLLASPTPVVTPPVDNTDNKPKDRRAKQSRTFEQTMRVSVRHLDNLNNLVGELVVNRNTLEQDQNRMRQFVEKLLSEVQKLNEVGKRMQDLYERSLMENSLVASRQQYKPIVSNNPANNDDAGGDTLMEYDPLEMDRFTPIHLLSQKMIELTVRVRESTADIEFVVDGSTEVTRTLRQITGQLQEDLTKSRMLPFAQTADRLQRGVRDNGLKYGKQIELTIEGRDTLIDKVILESLSEPLIHMVNNAIAHGIESGETRQEYGKSIEGKITIRALHQGNQTIISIADDGAGIDTDRVKTKAIEKGIITRQQAAAMSKNDIYELLFLPSFSTKDQADELSGRGVGMDVVKTSITEIRGTISTESQLGIGTTFTIRLPLALSIAKALIAVNNKCNIAFPMDGIEDTQDVSPEQIQTNSKGEQCIFWRDELMPFKPLSDLLGFNRPLARNNFYSTHEDDSDLVSILILRSDGNLMAIQVDKIDSDREIVIKPLQGPASKPLGIAGATVMGDGRIIPIADVMELIDLAKGTLSRHISPQWTAQMAAPTVEVRESMVLIVDDSITVRELLSLTFKRAGYRVEQARDGQEAWDKLRAGLPCDIVFCDIEMPRMDGLEFLSRIQKDVALSKVPVAMLTSRGSDRHRQIAAQLGASGYFIKPYLEEALLEAAKRMIGGEVLQIV